MSKLVKELVQRDFERRLEGVEEALLVSVIGMPSNDTVRMRRELRAKDIQLMVVKTSLARRATQGTPLEAAFTDAKGSVAVCWGAEDFVALAKEVTRLDGDSQYPQFETRGGVMDGEALTAERVKEISKWPSRMEQLSLLSGQILGPGSNLSGAMLGPGGALASQIKQKSEDGEG